jgi:hypothetical protein
LLGWLVGGLKIACINLDVAEGGDEENSTVLRGMTPALVLSNHFLHRFWMDRIETGPPPVQILMEW